MVSNCAAYNCPMVGEKQVTQSGTQFHKFPRDPELRAKWVLALRRVNFTPSRHSSVCSKHFESDCFEPPGYRKKRKLKRGSIPTIFDFPKHLQRTTTKRKPPKIRTDPPPKTAQQIETVMLSTNLPGQVENLCEVFFDESHQPISLSQHESCFEHQVDPLGIKTEENATVDTEFVIAANSNICDMNHDVTEPCTVNSAAKSLDVISISSASCGKETFTSEIEIKDEEIVGESSSNPDFTNESYGDSIMSVSQNQRKKYIGDYTENDMEVAVKAKRFFKTAHQIMQQKKLNIKTLRQNIRRKDEKIASLEERVKYLETQLWNSQAVQFHAQSS